MIKWLLETLSNRKYNQGLKNMGVVDESEVHLTSVGWQPDGTFIPDSDNKMKSTASNNPEFYKVIRRGKRRE